MKNGSTDCENCKAINCSICKEIQADHRLNKCCESQAITDLTSGLGKERHHYCHSCKSHYWMGKFWNRSDWEEYVNRDEEGVQ